MRKGPAGTTTLNPLLQQLLNPPDPAKHELPRHAGAHGGTAGAGARGTAWGGTAGTAVFRVGDRVIQLINNYDKDIFNGDQGIVSKGEGRVLRIEKFWMHLQRGARPGRE